MDELEPKELGETGEEELDTDVEEEDDEVLGDGSLDSDPELDAAIDNGDVPPGAVEEVETASYEITGLVDHFDEQGNITGQLDIGSIQVLPVVVGDKAVAEGRAKRVE